MGRINHAQVSFTTGEISPEFDARIDHEKYGSALRSSQNALVLPQGPITRRPGFRYVAEVKDSTEEVRLLPFEFNVEQSYALEVGEEYIRFYTDEARLTDSITGKGLTNGNFASGDLTGWTDADVGTGASSFSAGTMLLAGGAGTDYARRYQQLVSGLGLNTYTVTLDVGVAGVTYEVGTAPGGTDIATGNLATGVGRTFQFTLTSQSNVYLSFRNQTASTSPTVDNIVLTLNSALPYEIDHDYTEEDLRKIKHTQSADVFYIACEGFRIYTLNRLGALRWTREEFIPIDGPFNPINTDAAKTLTTSAAGALGTAVTITATGHSPFVQEDEGRLIRHKHAGMWRSIRITNYTSATQVEGIFQEDNPTGYTAGASSDWRMGSWSDAEGWPSVISFYQQRLILANNETWPSKVWGSESGLYDHFSPTEADGTVVDGNGLDILMASDQVNSIVWLSPAKVLCVGTVEGEWIIRAGQVTNPEALSPTNAIASRETTWGSDSYLEVNRPGSNVVLFIDRPKRKIREYLYDYQTDGFVAPELTLLARHLTKSGIVDTCYADDVLWVALDNGKLVSMTYLREQQVVGFAEHVIGGTNAKVKSLCAITAPDLSHKQVWAIIERTINGSSKKYIEYMNPLFDPEDEDDKDGAFFVDSGLTYDGVATNTITGLDHLEGQTVAILADGSPRPDKTVSGGSITLGSTNETKASVVQVGLPTTFEIELLDPEGGGDNGTAMGKTKRCDKVKIKFINTLGCKVGPDEDNLDDVQFRDSDDPMDSSPPLFTGYKEIEFEGDYVDDFRVVIRNDQPLPITISAILLDISVNES